MKLKVNINNADSELEVMPLEAGSVILIPLKTIPEGMSIEKFIDFIKVEGVLLCQ